MNDDAFTAFVREHAASLSRLAHQLTHDSEEAADLVQEVFFEAHRRWHRVTGARSSYAYVRRMMVNRHIDRTRLKRLPTQELSEDVPAHDLGGAQEHAERDQIWLALAALPPKQRAVLVLRHYEDCTDEEIATVLKCRRATVRSLAARAAAALRPLLAYENVGNSADWSH